MTLIEVISLLEMQVNPDLLVLLDDGECYIEQYLYCALNAGNGFLERRYAGDRRVQTSQVLLGGYEQVADGRWQAMRLCSTDGQARTKLLGSLSTRNEAIATLWLARHEVFAQAEPLRLTNNVII